MRLYLVDKRQTTPSPFEVDCNEENEYYYVAKRLLKDNGLGHFEKENYRGYPTRKEAIRYCIYLKRKQIETLFYQIEFYLNELEAL